MEEEEEEGEGEGEDADAWGSGRLRDGQNQVAEVVVEEVVQEEVWVHRTLRPSWVRHTSSCT